MKKFHLGDVLSVVTGHLLSPRNLDGLQDFLEYMTSDKVFRHQMSRVMDECRPFLLKQFPQFAEIHLPGDPPRTLTREWLAELVVKYGEELEVDTIPKEAHQVKDPMIELAEMRGGSDTIIPVMTN